MSPDKELRQTEKSEASGTLYHRVPILPRLTELKKPVQTPRKPLDRWVHLRLTEDEEKAFAQLQAEFHEKSRSGLLRKMIREAIGQGPDLNQDDLDVFQEAVRQLGALGRNINQIARAINSGQITGFLFDPHLLNTLDHEIASIRGELMNIILKTRGRWVQDAGTR